MREFFIFGDIFRAHISADCKLKKFSIPNTTPLSTRARLTKWCAVIIVVAALMKSARHFRLSLLRGAVLLCWRRMHTTRRKNAELTTTIKKRCNEK